MDACYIVLQHNAAPGPISNSPCNILFAIYKGAINSYDHRQLEARVYFY